MDIESWVVLWVPAPKILLVAIKKGVWSPRNWQQRCPTANGTNNLPKDDQFATSITIIAVHHINRHMVKVFFAPRPEEHQSVRPAFFNFQAKQLMCLHPVSDTSRSTRKHSIKKDWLKQLNNQKCDKEATQMFRKKYGTNLIARPGNGDIHSAGRQDKPLPKAFDQFWAPTQLEHINERWNFL